MRTLRLLLTLVFFLGGPGCKQSQEEPTATTEGRGIEKAEEAPELTGEEMDKLKSLGYVE